VRVRKLLQRLLLGLSLSAFAGSVSIAAYLVYDARLTPPAAHSAPDLRLLASDPGGVYDRRPVTPTPSPVPTSSPTPSPNAAAPPPPQAPQPANSRFRMVIDSIGVNAPVVPEGLTADDLPIMPLNAYDVAWYTFTAQPGAGGNAVFSGHVTWNGLAVFYYLNQVSPGDSVRLVGNDGTTLVYTVTDSFIVDENDPSALNLMAPSSSDTITIISCDGNFYRTNNPVSGGDYTGRRVVRASFTSR
jgi:LPXTG-site transpeptidase (sortase) family protein